MGKDEKPKRPKPVKSRKLPPDAKSLEAMLRRTHRDLLKKAEHLKREPHDTKKGRAGFAILHQQRAEAAEALANLGWSVAIGSAPEFVLTITRDEVLS